VNRGDSPWDRWIIERSIDRAVCDARRMTAANRTPITLGQRQHSACVADLIITQTRHPI
jgi:hypothetical protein